MPTGVYKRTEEYKRKVSERMKGRVPSKKAIQKAKEANTGRKLTKEHRQKISKALRGKPSGMLGKKQTEEAKHKIGKSNKGEKHYLYGKNLSKECRRKISETLIGRNVGEKNPNWRGGVTSIRKRIRESYKYIEWRQQCFIRDNFTCQKCRESGGKLEVHHKKSFKKLILEAKKYLPLFNWYDSCLLYIPLWNIDNGITLCHKCHKEKK